MSVGPRAAGKFTDNDDGLSLENQGLGWVDEGHWMCKRGDASVRVPVW